MVATAIMGLIGLLVFMVYSGSTTMWFTTSERIDLHHSVRRAVNRIALEVRMATWVDTPVVGTSKEEPETSLVFVPHDKGDIISYVFDSSSGEIRRNGELVANQISGFGVAREHFYQLYIMIEATERNQKHSVEQDVNLRNIRIPQD